VVDNSGALDKAGTELLTVLLDETSKAGQAQPPTGDIFRANSAKLRTVIEIVFTLPFGGFFTASMQDRSQQWRRK
jgi:hypothetical protein